ncbi:tRNA (34-2'-O)-methyltransferase regulator RTT10 [Aspergillus undulatus]|uniref:tRNA (34-2'-O)-methyltransferase regulator RTT10 n=1 Tax=Aspergillus undulatus TaxID=1810928 RepID=UPI003CCCEC73
MLSTLEHIDAYLPVTALKILDLGGAKLVLVGQGTFARLIEEPSGKVLSFVRAFKRNHVHGYAVLRNEQEAGTHNVRLVVWGGESLRLIDLNLSTTGSSEEYVVSLSIASAEYAAPDWILAGCSQTDGSAAYLVTAHNAVLGMSVVEDASSRYDQTLHLRQLAVSVKSVLYSAQIVPVTPSNLLVAAGTVFGEIIVWSCFIRGNQGSAADAVGSIHHFFTGHEGSIFDVEISSEIPNLHGDRSGRLLASCSDDRTVRVWDISDCEHASPDEPSAYSTDGFELRSTGFGHAEDEELNSESCVATAFGHGARIWGVDFVAERSDVHKISLISRGEDVHCLLWELSWQPSEKPEFKLTNTCTLRPHNGKHIWSLAMYTTGAETEVYTGGNDGAVRTFKLVQEDGQLVCPNWTTRIPVTPGSEDTKGAKSAMRAFGFVSPECFIAITTIGEVQLGRVESANSVDRHIASETLFVEEDLGSYCAFAGLPSQGVALIGNKQGVIRLFNYEAKSLTGIISVGQRPVALHIYDYHSDASSTVITFLTTYMNPEITELFHINLTPNAEPRVEKATVHVPAGFDVASTSLIHNDEYIAIGTRYGSLAVYRKETTGDLRPLLKVFRVHSKEGLTRIIPFTSLSPAAAPSPYFLTCGRDGTYRVNVLEITESAEEPVSLRTLHTPTTLGFHIEGAYIDRSSQELMLYGFGGMSFVVWNESTQSEVAKVHCGGAHRRWAFQPSSERPEEGLLLWSRSGLNASHISTRLTRSIRAGVHGRETRALGTYQQSNGKPLIVTGSEDTTLRIFTPGSPSRTGPWGALECIRVLTAHDSAPQHIAWSKDGRFLFTSSAMEDFFLWKISSIPVFGLSAALQGWCPKSHPKSELRVTCFDLLEVEDGQAEASFLLCLVYSNSTIKVFHVSCANEDSHFTLLASGTYTSNCLTQVRFLQSTSSLCLITTSTDGHFTLWDITTVLENYYNLTPTLSLKEPLTTSLQEETIACETRHPIHSNSIKTIDLVRVSDTTTLILSGGDDNAVTISLLHAELDLQDTEPRASTITIPDAHTASVNAVKAIEQSITISDGKAQFTFASSGNDHRVKMWRVEVDMSSGARPTLENLEVQNVLDRYSPVADISCLDIVRDEGQTKLLVCGVGMELFTVGL